MRTWLLAGLLGCLLTTVPAFGADASQEKGTVRFRPNGDQAKVPEQYRLDECLISSFLPYLPGRL